MRVPLLVVLGVLWVTSKVIDQIGTDDELTKQARGQR